jgi:type VI secretion system (T6SS) effector TldE1-like protein
VWIFDQSNGELRLNGILLGTGYSGHDLGKNNPAMQNDPGLGPIPAGFWDINGPPQDTKTHGPCTLRLEPRRGTETFGRAGFLIHGDSLEHPGQGSQGCIALSPRQKRSYIWQSGDTRLLVISGLSKFQETQP